MVIWKQNRAHSPHILKDVSQITKKHDTLNLSTMGEMKNSRFPIVQKPAIKKDAQFYLIFKAKNSDMFSCFFDFSDRVYHMKNLHFIFILGARQRNKYF